MTVLAYFELKHATARKLAAAAMDTLPDGTVIVAREPVRSLEANDKLHAICGEIAKSHIWHGLTLDTEAWKRIFVEAWSRTEGRPQGRLVPALDGKGIVALGIQTRSLSKADMSDLIQFIEAWHAENEVIA